MKIKKICAALSALALSAGMLSNFPAFDFPMTVNASVISDDFEINYDGWTALGDTTILTADSTVSHNSKRGMFVSNRQNSNDGVASNKGLYLEEGVEYDYGVYVYHTADETEKFRLSVSYSLTGSNETGEINIDVKSVKNDEWTELSGKTTLPKNAENIIVKITTDSTSDFYFDDFNVMGKIEKSANSAYAANSDSGLKDRYAKYFRVGSVLNGYTVTQSTITANIIKEFNSITFENEMKPDFIMDKDKSSGTNVAVSLNACASLMNFCVENNIGVRGHTLVWHGQMPKWFFKENFDENANWVSEAVMDQRMESYIKNTFAAIKEQYPSLDLYAYDVCNECVSDDINRTANYGGAREPGWDKGKSPWVQIYGDNKFVEKAFTYARKYAPSSCSLFYNDYNEYWDHKRDAIYKMCKSLYEKDVLDGIGMQSHIGSEMEGWSGVPNYTTALELYASIGCQVQITELDVSTDEGAYTADQQAEKYKAIFQAAVNVNKNSSITGNVTAVCVWGPNDANTWIGTENSPLLFDTNNQPKPAYYAVANLLPESEWGSGSNTNPGELKPNDFGWYFNNGFESGTDGWTARNGAELASSSQTGYVGSSSLYVSNRPSAWGGAQTALSTTTFKPGTEYSFSANVKYTSGNATDTFVLKLQYVDANGNTQYPTIAESTAIKGEWVQLANMNYKIPSDASDMYLYIETIDSTNSFYIDETIVAVGGTGILGAGTQKIIRGDVNLDGVINCFDSVLAKRGYLNGFGSTASQIAADVDQSGVVDVTDIKLIQEFLVKKITAFPVAEPVVPPVDTAAMEQLFSTVTPAVSYKEKSENNPLYTQRFGADPGVMEYNGRIYVYTTNDAFEYDSDGSLKENSYDVATINCISSADLVNWTDHGPISVARQGGAASWAWASWAPCAAHKTINGKEKFFLYFANSAGGIGVLTADSPEGPWTDPLGKPMITGDMEGCKEVIWMFDPAVFVDDDGTGYITFGGGHPDNNPAHPKTARVAKLSDDMISLATVPREIDAPYIFEDSGINKINGTYYYTYCTNFGVPQGNEYGFNSGEIAYMTSDNPLGPYTYKGVVLQNPGTWGCGYGNNHHSIGSLNGKWYMFYHGRMVENAMGISKNYRSPQVNELVESFGKLELVKGSKEGVPQQKSLDPYEKIQAETIFRQGGIQTRGLGDTIVTDIQKGDWISVAGANFSNGANSVTVSVSSNKGGAIKVCTGDENGTAVGYIEVPVTGGNFIEVTAPVSGLSGTQNVYLIFSDEMEMDYWYFS